MRVQLDISIFKRKTISRLRKKKNKKLQHRITKQKADLDIKYPVPYMLSNHKSPTSELVKHLKREKFLLQMLSVF